MWARRMGGCAVGGEGERRFRCWRGEHPACQPGNLATAPGAAVLGATVPGASREAQRVCRGAVCACELGVCGGAVPRVSSCVPVPVRVWTPACVGSPACAARGAGALPQLPRSGEGGQQVPAGAARMRMPDHAQAVPLL